MKSYDIVEWGKPLQQVVRDKPVPEGSEVLVRVLACGVCHSDVHIREGALDLGQGRRASFDSIGVKLPFTMGHEIVGTIEAAGPDASVESGAPVVIYPWAGCGHCRHCLAGDELSCDAGRALGTRRAGGFAEFVVVAHQRYLLDYGDLDPMLAATCACSGLTAYSAWKKAGSWGADDTVLLIGAGGLGLAAFGLAPAMTKARVVLADIDTAKLSLAASLGAATLDMSGPSAATALRSMAGEGVRAVIDFVGAPATLEFAMKVAGRGANIVVVGLFGGAMPLSTALLPMRNLSLRGSYVGSLEEMRELLALVARGTSLNVPLMATPMAEVNDALDALAAGRVKGRMVAMA